MGSWRRGRRTVWRVLTVSFYGGCLEQGVVFLVCHLRLCDVGADSVWREGKRCWRGRNQNLVLLSSAHPRTQEAGGQKPRVLSIDDYYMAEVTEEKTDERGVKRKVAVMKYQHDAEMEEVWLVVVLGGWQRRDCCGCRCRCRRPFGSVLDLASTASAAFLKA